MRRSILSALLAACTVLAPLSAATAAPAPNYVVLDNDFLGPGGSNIQSIIPLLNRPGVTLLGLTSVVGDDWENAGTAHALRFLEIARQTQIPVADGATTPLVNTVAETKLREQQFGIIPWKGAWGGLGSIEHVPATQPPVRKLTEGAPHTTADALPAAMFLIREVHAHPHQVTIIAAGPLTNLALAIRIDPTFAETAKQLVFMGGLLDASMMSVTGNADFASDFNLIMDPEAAQIALTAPWPAITCVGNVSNDIMMTPELANRIDTKHNAVTDYLQKYQAPLPLWDELTSAIAVDPTLITKSVTAIMNVNIDHGMDYGHAHIWPDSTAPKGMGLRKVKIVQSIDKTRFINEFVSQSQNAVGTH
ncbi:nucleoside hydrolase [Gluconobacter kondonii]|uniref:nucleoside hydrolase n=1 Tax=Gluconobacter kondonii TaxID=941463 RepID=UPI001B8A916B|nr:nucleoside hydrolase [Gluconobacter kondonii]MBS1064776.1 nucleoside hydrolase [Gluconobacter kondonii]MBS1079871.1 nucleoside hydrolase [Gluconobacter kondonii]MBS1082688.1 nucleoside hydrolase [Gluconobacter kondonii]